MTLFRRDLQGIFLGMKDIPSRDVSAFTMKGILSLVQGGAPNEHIDLGPPTTKGLELGGVDVVEFRREFCAELY